MTIDAVRTSVTHRTVRCALRGLASAPGVVALSVFPVPASALGAPFVCRPSVAYYSAAAAGSTQLYTVSDATSPYTLTPIGTAAPSAYNGIGYDWNLGAIAGL